MRDQIFEVLHEFHLCLAEFVNEMLWKIRLAERDKGFSASEDPEPLIYSLQNFKFFPKFPLSVRTSLHRGTCSGATGSKTISSGSDGGGSGGNLGAGRSEEGRVEKKGRSRL